MCYTVGIIFAIISVSCSAQENIIAIPPTNRIDNYKMDFSTLLKKLARIDRTDILEKSTFENILGARLSRQPENLSLPARFDFATDVLNEPNFFAYYSNNDAQIDNVVGGHSFSVFIKNTQILNSTNKYCVDANQAKLIWKTAGWKNVLDSPESNISGDANNFDSFGMSSFRYEKNGVRVHYLVNNNILPDVFIDRNVSCVVDVYMSEILK